MIKEPSFGTPGGLLTCLLTYGLRTTPIGFFPDHFSFREICTKFPVQQNRLYFFKNNVRSKG